MPPEGQDKSSSFTADKMVWNVPPNVFYMKRPCITVGLKIALIKRILAETFVGGLIFVAPNLLYVNSERSNYT